MSTLETAIVFSLILIMLTFMITGPEAIALDIFYMERDREVAERNYVGGVVCYDASPERLCTYLTGLSDNFRLLYGAVFDLSQEED